MTKDIRKMKKDELMALAIEQQATIEKARTCYKELREGTYSVESVDKILIDLGTAGNRVGGAALGLLDVIKGLDIDKKTKGILTTKAQSIANMGFDIRSRSGKEAEVKAASAERKARWEAKKAANDQKNGVIQTSKA